ncbi:hypothetical protein [Clostridium psychrophilum]|uniref:hypothetical protein n=1 Tax=Clostridium psychrophilum TaxID=132926 RepID=UPI001C0B844D|nr:hypothetical protein [Clostridium psychrophilum]MBU3182032.1 hypothetical protein [Clostridium psychrophilum]
MEKYIYIVISRTSTFTGKMIRKFLKEKYNHASISLDKNLTSMYSFSRLAISNPLVGGIVHESSFTLTIGHTGDVPIVVYRIPVTDVKYKLISKFVYDTYNDAEVYYYNFIQAIGLVFNKKHAVYKTYICTEFVMEALRQGEVNFTSLESYKIKPIDICEIMKDYIFYLGNLNDYPYRYETKTKDDELFFRKTGFIYEGWHTIKHFYMVVSRDRNNKRSKSKAS